MIHLEEIGYSAPVGISVDLYFVSHEDVPETRILVVKVAGDYPSGSLGTTHARYISSESMKAIVRYDPDAVLLDVSKLSYAWGDGLLGTIQDVIDHLNRGAQADEPDYPFAMITSPENRVPIMTLLGGPDYSPDWSQTSMQSAVEYLRDAFKEWLDY